MVTWNEPIVTAVLKAQLQILGEVHQLAMVLKGGRLSAANQRWLAPFFTKDRDTPWNFELVYRKRSRAPKFRGVLNDPLWDELLNLRSIDTLVQRLMAGTLSPEDQFYLADLFVPSDAPFGFAMKRAARRPCNLDRLVEMRSLGCAVQQALAAVPNQKPVFHSIKEGHGVSRSTACDARKTYRELKEAE